tara:strand:+ start:1029 stop:1352 length:324 start_codon:yes stop_codon:yes gene_type:complete
MQINERLNALVKANNSSIREIAEKCGVSKNTASRWLSGLAIPTRGENLTKLAELLHTTESYIAYGISEPATSDLVLSQKLGMLSNREKILVEELVDYMITPIKEIKT